MQINNNLIVLPEGHPARYGINPSNILNDVKNKNYSELNRAISILSKKEASFFTGSKDVYLQFMPIFNKAFKRNVIDSDILRKIVNCCQEAEVFSAGELKKNVLIKCDNGETISANKLLLCLFSDYFKNCFNIPLIEADKVDGIYTIQSEYSSEIMSQIELFLRTSKLPDDLSLDFLCDLYLAGDYYQIGKLKSAAFEKIENLKYTIANDDSWWATCSSKLYQVLEVYHNAINNDKTLDSEKSSPLADSDKGKEKVVDTDEENDKSANKLVEDHFVKIQKEILTQFFRTHQISGGMLEKGIFLSLKEIYLLSKEGFFSDLIRNYLTTINIQNLDFESFQDICQSLPHLLPEPFKKPITLSLYTNQDFPNEFAEFLPQLAESFPDAKIIFSIKNDNEFVNLFKIIKEFPNCSNFTIYGKINQPFVSCELDERILNTLEKINIVNLDVQEYHFFLSNDKITEEDLTSLKETLLKYFGSVDLINKSEQEPRHFACREPKVK